MTEPGFLVVGAARSGTTALHQYLKQHPQIFLPSLKEPCFYCFAGEKINYKKGKFAFAVTDEKEYRKLFRNSGPAQLPGEMSTPYLYLYSQTIQNIFRYHSDPARLKILMILRNPADRAYSQYLWRVRDGRENLSFEEALKVEKQRMEENYSFDYLYAYRGLYFNQVKAYLENFNHVKIVRYEDFKSGFENTMSGICEFLGVDADFKFTRKPNVNSSAFPRFGALGKMITVESKIKFKLLNYIPEQTRMSIREQFIRWNTSNKFPQPVAAATRIYLQEFFRDDIKKLGSLTGIDFSSWLNPEK